MQLLIGASWQPASDGATLPVAASGLGREGGPEGIHEYLEAKYAARDL